MKPAFKCDYCKFIGDEEQVKEHELNCMYNHDRKSCYTCTHRQFKGLNLINCDCGIEIPEGKIYEFCKSYERKDKINYDVSNIFGSLFGGV